MDTCMPVIYNHDTMKQHYHTSDNLNLSLSKRAAKKTHAIPNACWINAYCALMELPELAHGYYVEGWFVNIALPVPIEHAWIELDGQIIDPTPVSWSVHHAYFPALRFTKHEIAQEIMETVELPIAWRYGWSGMKHPDYARAYKQAWSFGIPSEKLEKILRVK